MMPISLRIMATCLIITAALLISNEVEYTKKAPKDLTVLDWVYIMLGTTGMLALLWTVWFETS